MAIEDGAGGDYGLPTRGTVLVTYPLMNGGYLLTCSNANSLILLLYCVVLYCTVLYCRSNRDHHYGTGDIPSLQQHRVA